MAQSIRTEIVIRAEAGAIWAALTDFAAHPTWNPFFASMTGDPAVGSRLTLRFRNGMTIRPTVTEAREGLVFEWFGQLLFGGLFDGRHRFELIPEDGGTRLVHSETFSGLLIPFMSRLLARTEREFIAFNDALKNRVERDTPWRRSSA